MSLNLTYSITTNNGTLNGTVSSLDQWFQLKDDANSSEDWIACTLTGQIINEYDLSYYDEENDYYIGFFEGCKNLTSVNMSNVTIGSQINICTFAFFYECSSLIEFDLGALGTQCILSDPEYMFYKCSSLESVDLSNISCFGLMDSFFQECENLKTIKMFKFSDYGVHGYLNDLFRGCVKLENIEWTTDEKCKLVLANNMFYNCQSLTSIDLTNLFLTSEFCTSIEKLCYGCTALITFTWSDFNGSTLEGEQSEMEEWDVSSGMQQMFQNCVNLTTVNMTINAPNVTSIGAIFAGCHKIEEIDLSNWVFALPLNMTNTFTNCYKLKTLKLPTNGIQAKSLLQTFGNCNEIENLDLTKIDTHLVTTMESTFTNCYALKNLDISTWVDSNVTNTFQLFCECHALEVLNLPGFEMINEFAVNKMFYNCINLKYINVDKSHWWLLNNPLVTASDMFTGCTQLLNFNPEYTGRTKAFVGEGGYLCAIQDYLVQKYIKKDDDIVKIYPKINIDNKSIIEANGIIKISEPVTTAFLTEEEYNNSEIDSNTLYIFVEEEE